MQIILIKKIRNASIAAFLFFIHQNAFSDDSTWYRNDISSMAYLTISGTNFNIIAGYNGKHGEISGDLIKITDTIFYSYLEDLDSNQRSLFVFEFSVEKIKLTVYGDQINAGAFVSYDGFYENNKITDEEYENKYLIKIFNVLNLLYYI